MFDELIKQLLDDVNTAAAELDRGSQELDVHKAGEVAGLLQSVHARHLHYLTHDLVCNLKFYGYQY